MHAQGAALAPAAVAPTTKDGGKNAVGEERAGGERAKTDVGMLVRGSGPKDYSEQLQALRAMGWRQNEEMNLYLLHEHSGDVQQVCHYLLENYQGLM